ncbi:MAG: DUF2157 domain-containing protein [Candidatus Aureabacteria bacterium]|nr:DUF2157 domain-containing protein [Candidatus Auribacterota bacterium]
MNKCPISRYQWTWLKRHIEWWSSLKLISGETAGKIADLYAFEKEVEKRQSSVSMPIKILTVFGSVLVGLGVILFISFNWQHMSPFFKIGTVSVLLCFCHFLAALFYSRKYEKSAVSLSLLGNIVFGADIYLVAQVFNIISRFPNGIFLWAIGSALTAYLYRSKTNYFFTCALLVLWVLGESIGYKTANYLFIPVLLGVMLPLGYWLKLKTGVIISLFVAWYWMIANSFIWISSYLSIVQMMPAFFFGVMVYLCAYVHRDKENVKYLEPYYKWAGAAFMLLSASAFANIGIFEDAKFVLNGITLPSLISMVLLLVCVAVLYGRYSLGKDKIFIPLAVISALLLFFLPSMKYFKIIAFMPVAVVLLGFYGRTENPVFPIVLAFYVPFYMLLYSMRWESVPALASLMVLIGVMLYSLNWLSFKKSRARMAFVYGYLGLCIVLFVFYLFSFNLSPLGEYSRSSKISFEFWIIWGLVLSAAAISIVKTLGEEARPRLFEFLALVLGAVFSVLMVMCVYLKYFGVYVSGISNIIIVVLSTGIIITGYRVDKTGLKAIGFAFLILEIFSRYFDAGWDFLTRSVMFISVGIALIIAGVLLEKNKEKLLIKGGI